MNRTLRRPMFRIGGVAEGITSGLAPRQGYANNNAYDQLVKQIPKIQEQAKKLSYSPRGTNVYDFMTEFGLDIASRPPVKGGILATAATSAKEPYARFMERKQSAAEQEYGSESDMFKTMLGSYGDILAAREEGEGGKTYQIKVKAEMVRDAVKKISKLERRINNGEDEDGSLAIDLNAERINLNNLSKDDPYVDALLGNKEYVQDFIDEIMKELEQEMGPDGNPQWTGVDLFQEAQRRFKEYIQGREADAKGGRVGYQNAGAVMPNAMPTAMQAPGPTDQGTEVPEELQNIDFETLRARLPSTITDDIVRLIANSAEAMEDFATIQTQQDINNFNEKYGVELVLPAEA